MAKQTEDGQAPHSLEAEKAVLRAMRKSRDAIADIVEVLHDVDFYRPEHGLIYTAILDLFARDQPHDPIAVSAELAKQQRLEQAGGSDYVRAPGPGETARDGQTFEYQLGGHQAPLASRAS
jgi:replicative DNA helicase